MRLRFIFVISISYLISFFILSLVKNYSDTGDSYRTLTFQDSLRGVQDCDETYQIYKSSNINWQFIRSDGPTDSTLSQGFFYNRDELIFIEECLSQQLEVPSQINPNYLRCIGIQYSEGVGKSKSPIHSLRYFEEAAKLGDLQSLSYAYSIKALINYELWKLKLPPKYELDNYSICSNTMNAKLSKLIGDIADHQSDYILSDACKARSDYLNRALDLCKKARGLYETSYPADIGKMYSLWGEAFDLGGYSAALVNMGLLREIGPDDFQNKKLAYQHYKKASEMGNVYGMRNLAKLMEGGSKQDQLLVRQLYERAAYLGDFYAMQKLGYSDPNSSATIMRIH